MLCPELTWLVIVFEDFYKSSWIFFQELRLISSEFDLVIVIHEVV